MRKNIKLLKPGTVAPTFIVGVISLLLSGLIIFMESEKEVWVDIKGYEGIYQISNFGKVKSLARILPPAGKRPTFHTTEKILKENTDRSGYKRAKLNNKYVSIHRLVAIHFIPNPLNLPEVNHLNGIKSDNRYTELEWCTRSSNQYHAYATGLKKPAKSTRGGKWDKRSKPIFQILHNGESKKWDSMGDAARSLGFSRSNIWTACKTGIKCGGFKWKYI